MPSNPDARSYMLRFGPYAPPAVQIGDEIQCEIRGMVTVADWSDRGDIMWPRCKTTRRRALIVHGDLVRAMENETELAVCRLWDVEPSTVMKWKVALKIPARTPGTEVVVAEKSREQMIGKPALPQTKAALLRAAERPKPRKWKRKMSALARLRSIEAGKIVTGYNADRAAEILAMRANGARLQDIADVLGVTRQRIHKVVSNTTTRRDAIKDRTFTAPRCRCGLYSKEHARRINHDCMETR